MVSATTQKNSPESPKATAPRNKTGNGSSPKSASKKPVGVQAKRKTAASTRRLPEIPSWLATVMSVVGVGVAVGAGLYATRNQWMSKAEEWRNDFSAAFADDETDHENFDQTRNAGPDSMRDDPGNDWGTVDDMSDASFPASDPPSFNPGTA
ncbi:MAG: hypothetical protein WBO17_01330 [Sphingorhabdus sp.]